MHFGSARTTLHRSAHELDFRNPFRTFLPSCVRPLLPSYLPSVIAAFVGINQLSVGREVGSDAKEDHYLALPEAFFRAGNEPKFGLDSLSKA